MKTTDGLGPDFGRLNDALGKQMGGRQSGGGKGEQREQVLLPTPFHWREPSTIPPRPWLYGMHLLRKQVSVTVAPGGVGKSSLTIVEALAMASGRNLLGDQPRGKLRVWLFNLEDPRDELERRVVAAMIHHNISPAEIEGNLFLDTGRERQLCTAAMTRNGVQIIRPQMDSMELQLRARQIDVATIDPFVSSHQVPENDNGAIDLVAKEWAALADRCNCAIELVHHTRKLNGDGGTSESGRGATALLAAARSGRVLNRMSAEQRQQAGVTDSATYFSVDRDKANLAPNGDRQWRRMASVHLSNGDSVGVAEAWDWPDLMSGLTWRDLYNVQQALDGQDARFSAQTDDWAGIIVAQVLGIELPSGKARVRRMIDAWLQSGALVKVDKKDKGRRERPVIEVGEWAHEI